MDLQRTDPAQFAELVAELLRVRVTRLVALSGGNINTAHRVELADGTRVFAKHNRHAPPGLFAAEARGLEWLRETNTVLVPRVLSVTQEPIQLLLLEYFEPASPTVGDWERFGRQLAEMHRFGARTYGDLPHNFIGTLSQDNTTHETWFQFWVHRRLEPQVRSAIDAGKIPRAWLRRFEQLFEATLHVLVEPEFPERIHGDLWSGNVLTSERGIAVIDPAAYGGHGEVDLAMMRLFGGFDARTFAAYAEVRGSCAPGLSERLRLYQLYPLLVHVNLFGGSYVGAVRAVLDEFVG